MPTQSILSRRSAAGLCSPKSTSTTPIVGFRYTPMISPTTGRSWGNQPYVDPGRPWVYARYISNYSSFYRNSGTGSLSSTMASVRPAAALVPTLTRPRRAGPLIDRRYDAFSRFFLIVPDVLQPFTMWMTSLQLVRYTPGSLNTLSSVVSSASSRGFPLAVVQIKGLSTVFSFLDIELSRALSFLSPTLRLKTSFRATKSHLVLVHQTRNTGLSPHSVNTVYDFSSLYVL